MDNVRFNWTDYLVFVMALGFSAFAAVVQGVMDGIKRKKMRGQEKRQGESKEVERNISGLFCFKGIVYMSLSQYYNRFITIFM